MPAHEDWLLEGVVVREEGKSGPGILKGVSTIFQAGRLTLLLGPNGAGKSTLLETMAGLRQPSEGTIVLGTRTLWERRRPDREVLLATGVSLQQSASQWFARTVGEEMRYSLRPYRLTREVEDRRIADALAAAGLPPELPSRDPLTLSGGQQRRLAWACLLAAQPAWLLLDEPTAGLDAEGVRGLCAGLAAHKAAGRGAVVATHDLDALWPLADAVVVLDDGRVREAAAAAAWAERAAASPGAARGLPAPPQAVATAAALRAAGFPLPRTAAAGAALAPSAAADALAEALLKRREAAAVERPAEPPSVEATNEVGEDVRPELGAASKLQDAAEGLEFAADNGRPAIHRWGLRDPRALWAAYLMLASALIVQNGWMGTAVALFTAAAVLWPLRKVLYPYRRVIRYYVLFTMLFALYASVTWSPFAISVEKLSDHARRMSVIVAVMALAIPLMTLISPFRLRRAIEQGLGPLSRFGLPVRTLALTVALLFRFIPMLGGEWTRFAKIAVVRGKRSVPPGSLPIRAMHTVLVPFMLSVLRLGDRVAYAMEVRGLGRAAAQATMAEKLRFDSADAAFTAAAVGLSLLLVGLDFYYS